MPRKKENKIAELKRQLAASKSKAGGEPTSKAASKATEAKAAGAKADKAKGGAAHKKKQQDAAPDNPEDKPPAEAGQLVAAAASAPEAARSPLSL